MELRAASRCRRYPEVKCARCGKALSRPAVEIPSRMGAIAFGPKCAKAAGLHKQKPRQTEAAEVQEGQIALDFGIL